MNFNKNSIYDTSSYISKCKFPYIDKNIKFSRCAISASEFEPILDSNHFY